MEILLRTYDRLATIIEIKGELDMYSSSKLKKIVKSLWEKECIPIIFDLKNLIFIDSSGIGVLLYCNNQMTERNQPFYLVNLCNAVHTVMRLTGIEGLLPIVDTMDNALSLIKK